MSLLVERPGLQSTLQDMGRPGWRHMGVPLCGAADPLALGLGNHLVGNPPGAVAVEMTLDGLTGVFEQEQVFALTGAKHQARLNEEVIEAGRTCQAVPGDRLEIGQFGSGCRAYLALGGGLRAGHLFGSSATYLPAGFGGHEGRALKTGDRLETQSPSEAVLRQIPRELLPPVTDGKVLRVVPGPEASFLSEEAREIFFTRRFRCSQRASRMGAELEGPVLKINSSGKMKSSAVFPGTVQCPESGAPFLLMADAQTTGGYPRIAQVIRADRHLMGQIRPGDTVRFMEVSPERAAHILTEKRTLYENWLGYPPEFI